MQDSELQFSVEGQKTNYYVNLYDRQDLTFIVQNLGSSKAKFSIEISSAPDIKIEPNSIKGNIKSGKSKRYQITIFPGELGIYDISILFRSPPNDEEVISLQLTVIDCFSKIPFYDISHTFYGLFELTNSENPMSGYYSNPENYNIFIILVEYILALLHLILDLDNKYKGLFSTQIKNYLNNLISRVNQLKMCITSKETINFFDMRLMSLGDGDKHPLKAIWEEL